MTNTISQSERIDILLALASLYNYKKNNKQSLESFVSSLSALNDYEQTILHRRARRFDELPNGKKEVWQAFWLEKLSHRGNTKRLDETVHPEQIAEILKSEPFAVQVIIQEKLPDLLANQVATFLQNQPLISIVKKKSISNKMAHIPKPNKKILSIVRQEFLNNFVAFEDIYKPQDIDKLSAKRLGNFIWKMGIREIAIYCRGIKTKEDLANFLKNFEESQTKEIVNKISKLENIKAERVLKAENLINEVFLLETDSYSRIRCLGLRLISIAFFQRDKNIQRYTIQKLPIEIGNILQANILISKKEFQELNQNDREIYREFGDEVFQMASEFLRETTNEAKFN